MRGIDELTEGSSPTSTRPPYSRLRNGLPLSDIWYTLRELTKDPRIDNYEYMSFLLDFHIDNGAMVPVVECVDGIYYRLYRPGEASPLEFAEIVHWMLVEHDAMFPSQPLNTTYFTKILAAIALYHPRKLPLEPLFEFRGRVAFVITEDKVTEQAQEAVRFLAKKNIIRLTGAKHEQQLSLFG
jgi:hypothetical protein